MIDSDGHRSPIAPGRGITHSRTDPLCPLANPRVPLL